MAGPITTRLGYRWTTMIGLMLMNATIFISFFANSLPVFLIGQLFEGMPWGLFIAVSPGTLSLGRYHLKIRKTKPLFFCSLRQ